MLEAGWQIEKKGEHLWEVASQKITSFIKSLNASREKRMVDEKIAYFNKRGRLLDAHTVELTDKEGGKEKVTAKYILIATGGRPTDPNIPGKEHTISSDDIFWLKKRPGRTLCVGASYIALECAGFLKGLGMDVTVMVRSILLRGFDQEVANKIGDAMEAQGVRFIRKAVPVSISLNEKGEKVVRYKQGEQKLEDTFDTVLFAIGRTADTKTLGVEEVGVKTEKNGKIIAGDDDKTAVPSIYAVGDCCAGRLELTPTAIMAGRLLAGRLFGDETRQMSYKYVATTVFTPLEYGSCGWSQEAAKEAFGKENILVYGSSFKPLQWALNPKRSQRVYAKIVVNKKEDRVIGFHYLGPNAGEITQGFAVALVKGVSKKDLDTTVAIHPTIAEVHTHRLRNSC